MSRAIIRRAFDLAARLFILGWAVRNVIGLIAVVPIFAELIRQGGTLMAIWIGVCSLAGVALNIALPTLAYRKIRARLAR
jgi:hypothetical protein